MWDRGRADDRMRGYAVNLAWFSLVIVVILFSALWIIGLVMPAVAHGYVGIDLTVYLDRTRDWMQGGSFYRDRQVTGAGYPVEHGDAFYPPVMLYLLVPFTVLPAILWWIIPGAIAVVALRRLRPNRWGWLLIAGLPGLLPDVDPGLDRESVNLDLRPAARRPCVAMAASRADRLQAHHRTGSADRREIHDGGSPSR